jgi:hypothetical protein
MEGIMREDDFLEFIPLNKSVLDRQPLPLRTWAESWLGNSDQILWTSTRDWFYYGHSHNNCIWTPPPAAAQAALEQLAKCTHKQPHHTHL